MIRSRRRKAKRGFAAMSPEKRREIARKGGQSVKPENRAFAQNRDLAAEAGRKGGSQSPGKRRRRKIPARRVVALPVAEVVALNAAPAPELAAPPSVAAEAPRAAAVGE
ncbi:MAG: general stress protein [Beijerinckiaceae bacterium]